MVPLRLTPSTVLPSASGVVTQGVAVVQAAWATPNAPLTTVTPMARDKGKETGERLTVIRKFSKDSMASRGHSGPRRSDQCVFI